jgi:hypothetical protein
VNFRMVDTCAVFKLPVRCPACGSQQYETLLRISQANRLVCVECRQSIDLPHDNAEIFSRAVAFVEEQQRFNGLLSPIRHAWSESSTTR